MRIIIRRLLPDNLRARRPGRAVPALLLLVLATNLSGCAAAFSSNMAAAIYLVPIMFDDGRGSMRERDSTYTDSRWFGDPDSHPAVRPKPPPKPPAGSAGSPPAATP